jgi:hypothetical protein
LQTAQFAEANKLQSQVTHAISDTWQEGKAVARNEKSNFSNRRRYTAYVDPICDKCGGELETVGNRLFIIYKRAQLPQPTETALVCSHCGWVEGDEKFQALLLERISRR